MAMVTEPSEFRSLEDARRALGESEAHLRSVLETVPDAIIVINDQGLIQSFSPAAERLFGYAADRVMGPERQDAHAAAVSRRARRLSRSLSPHWGTADHWDRPRRSWPARQRSTFPMELAVGEINLEGRRLFTGFVRDITERQVARERLQELQSELLRASRLSAMGQMASALAHELNQPLTAIINYVQATRRMLDNPVVQRERLDDAMDKAIAQASRAGQIIHRMRQFLQKGETERQPERSTKCWRKRAHWPWSAPRKVVSSCTWNSELIWRRS